MLSKLFVKDLGKVLKPWYKQIKSYSDLPYGIHTYDVVKGFSVKKGNFEIISYKNKDGKLLKRITSYTDKTEVITKDFTYDNYLTYINSRTTQAGTLTKNEYKTLRSYKDGSIVELSEQIGATPLLDKQKARYLRPKQAPREINVKDPWGKTEITSPRCSVGRMTLLKDRQYLPTVISNRSKERVNERVKSIEKVLSNKNKLPETRTNTQRASQKILGKDTVGRCNGLGNVWIWDELYTTPDLYETMGHESNHSKWFKRMALVFEQNTHGLGRKEFFTAKRLLKEESILNTIPYEEQAMERLAFREEAKVKQKFLDMFDNIVTFFER